jgi:hypothetical protein
LDGKFTEAVITAHQAAHKDYMAFCDAFPGWIPEMFERTLANIIHERFWASLRRFLEGNSQTSFVDKEPNRMVTFTLESGRSYVARVKRHGEGDRVSSYSTATDIRFWLGGAESFDGLEEVHLAVGYIWDSEGRQILDPIISYREGKDNVIWAKRLDMRGGENTGVFRWVDFDGPQMPGITLRDAAQIEDESAGMEK